MLKDSKTHSKGGAMTQTKSSRFWAAAATPSASRSPLSRRQCSAPTWSRTSNPNSEGSLKLSPWISSRHQWTRTSSPSRRPWGSSRPTRTHLSRSSVHAQTNASGTSRRASTRSIAATLKLTFAQQLEGISRNSWSRCCRRIGMRATTSTTTR